MDFSGIEKLSLLDYDSYLATTLFMAGCPFRCPFCHNKELVIDAQNTPTIPWDNIRDFLKSRVGVLDAVVITGGEPTIMPDLIDKIREIKELGFKVKLDTNGSNPKLLRKLIEEKLVNYVAMDIKNCKAKYGKTIGLENYDLKNVEESVKILMELQPKYEFRTTIIEEFHTLDDIKEIQKWIKGCKHYYLQRYVDREGCIAHGFHPIDKEKASSFLDALVDCNAQLRGY